MGMMLNEKYLKGQQCDAFCRALRELCWWLNAGPLGKGLPRLQYMFQMLLPVAELRNAELRARILSIVSCYSGHFGVSFWTADLLSKDNINNHCNKNQSSQGDSVA